MEMLAESDKEVVVPLQDWMKAARTFFEEQAAKS
jgi:hypothetical protein